MAQHDYVIDNSTGANVRADINSALQAIVTNNSGSSAPSSTFPFMLFADTSAGTMKIRNAADNGFIELFQLDGTFTLEDGSASTPALAFRNDLNTGIFSGGADEINIVAGGIRRADFGNAIVFNEDGADVDLRIEGDTEANLFYVDAGNNRIGIGTSSPSRTLSLMVGDSGANYIHVTNTTTGNADSDGTFFGIDSGEGALIWNQENTNIRFATNNTERMRIDSSGRVLVNTTTISDSNSAQLVVAYSFPVTGLELRSNSASNHSSVVFHNTNGEVGRIRTNGTATAYDQSGSDRSIKKNFESWNENVLELFKNINPQKFNYLVEEDGAKKTKGFIAQEITDSFPEAYSKQEGENEKYWFNPSGMVVYLMKAIQELEAKVAALEAA